MSRSDARMKTDLRMFDAHMLAEADEEAAATMSALHGYLTAIVSSPVLIPPSEWLPVILGDDELPEWSSDEETTVLITGAFATMNDIASTLMERPDEYEPLFRRRSADGERGTVDLWCTGFLDGVALRGELWNEMDARELLPMLLFGTDEGEAQQAALSTEDLELCQDAIAQAVRYIHQYWLERRDQFDPYDGAPFASSAPYVRDEPKVGRNDPCPCGSGKKYKRCCSKN